MVTRPTLVRNFCSEENVQLKETLEEKTKALEILIQEHQAAKAELEQALTKLKVAEDENRSLIDRWMLEKMKDAERLNEVIYCLFVATSACFWPDFLK
jgi:predicted nuclease with TOPRIM domain